MHARIPAFTDLSTVHLENTAEHARMTHMNTNVITHALEHAPEHAPEHACIGT